jgi:hypothetical protein
MAAIGRLGALLGVAALGWLAALALHINGIENSSTYLLLATTLLAVGLLSSTYGISVDSIRRDVRTVLVAVTLGVLMKAAIIAAFMFLVFHRREYVILAVAVAQIDPLSVAAIRSRYGGSKRASSLLSAWASFDDPVTTLLTIYIAGWLLASSHTGGRLGSSAGGLMTFGTGLLGNAALAAGAYLLWLAGRAVCRRVAPLDTVTRTPLLRAVRITMVLLLVALVAVAVINFLMLGLALIGLFFRPAPDKALRWVTSGAFLVATFALGLLLTQGVTLGPGVLLGLAAYGAQIVVGLLITFRLPRNDRIYLALGQQNGITAIILALLLESSFPGSAAIIAPAILVVNVLHTAANAIWRRSLREAAAPQPGQARPAGARPAATPATVPQPPVRSAPAPV